MKILFLIFCTVLSFVAFAQAPKLHPLEVPAHVLPVPDTISPQEQVVVAASFRPNWQERPKSVMEWKTKIAKVTEDWNDRVAKLRKHVYVKVEPVKIAGVNCFVITPKEIAPENTKKLLIEIHGGGFVFGPGMSGIYEGILLASHAKTKVISIDYRMAPDFTYPAALNDIMAVWKEIVKTTNPKNIAVYGTSAGGNLTLAMIMRAKKEGLPLPAAIATGTPWSDLTKTGDTYFSNDRVDNVIVSYDGWLGDAAKLYANGHNLKDPMLSPVYGDYTGFPPTILTSGTRDLLLSCTIRVHRKLRAAGIEAVLNVFEGQSHANYVADPFAPETKEYFDEVINFFNRHLPITFIALEGKGSAKC